MISFLNGNGQTKVEFEYSCCQDIKIRPKVTVCLEHSDQKKLILDHNKEDQKINFTIDRLDTSFLIVISFTDNLIFSDTIQYPFKLNGKEEKVTISIHFDKYFEKQKDAHLAIVSYYPPHEKLLMEYLPSCKSSETIKEPFFLLTNNSSDTLYGFYLEDFYWGSISCLKDSVWSEYYPGRIDNNFSDGKILYPDSTSFASVGSFGWKDTLQPGKYKFQLLYQTPNTRPERIKTVQKRDVVWSIIRKYNFKKEYEFEIK
jgi:hypothetical protein